MATLAFNKKPATAKPAPAAAEAAPEPTTAVATVPKASKAVATLAQSPQIQGEFTSRDMAIPFLNLGQKSGMMCDEHPEWIGTWVYDKATSLGDEVKVVFCRMRKYYEEITEFGGEDIPARFATADEYREAGYNDSQIRDVAELDLLIEATEEIADNAIIDAGESCYVPARYIVRSSAYGKTVGVLLKDLAGWLKNDLASGFYTMTTEKKSGKGNTWHVPKLTTAGALPAELRAAVKETLSV